VSLPDKLEEAKAKLAEKVEEVKRTRQAIFDKFDHAASDAADILIASMRAQAADSVDLGVKRLHKDAAKDVLKMAGFDIDRHERKLSHGGEGFKVSVVDYGNDRNNNSAPAQAAGA